MSKPFNALFLALLFALPSASRAHCDTLDGPVVHTAREALQTGKVNPVLAWVRPKDEHEIQAAFARARAVRKAGPEARALADTWFFETVVRVHRAGEGAPYTGLKPAGQDLGPAVQAADRAIDTGSPDAVEGLLADGVKAGVRERFARLKALKRPAEDVAAGRAWVEAYVPFVHYVEGVYQAASGGAGAHAEADGRTHGHAEPSAATHAHGEAAPAHPHGEHH
jgi:hypothetical protein